MWGELLLEVLNEAAKSANNDAAHETMQLQSQYQLAIEQEKTRQQKEETKRQIISGIIGGVFDVLSSCANAETDTQKK